VKEAMMKRFLNAAVAVVVLVALTGCGPKVQTGKAGPIKYGFSVNEAGDATVTASHDKCGEVLRAKGKVNIPNATCAAALEGTKLVPKQ
jgi:uncharacterized lipoprotein YehR (DUF1307 family)